MNILILGGTHFVGRTLADTARDAGHRVCVLNRGRTGTQPPGVDSLIVDRTDHAALAHVLAGTTWDCVFDTWTGAPSHATFAAAVLKDRVDHYAFVSTRSVYASHSELGTDETARVVAGDADSLEFDDYGVAKRGSELGVLRSHPRAQIARAGLIVGPWEDVGRLPWWLRRVERGGPMVAPGPVDRGLQLIDAGDLAEWMLLCAERGVGGVFNAVSPTGHATMHDILTAAIAAIGSPAELVWLTPDQIAQAGLEPWTELPLWLPPEHPDAGLHDCDVRTAVSAGLRCRPIDETVADTWAWLCATDTPDPTGGTLGLSHGIDPQREREVLAGLHR